jgi:hypothetical protein
MERVQTLLERLSQQVNDLEPIEDLLHTVQLMQQELLHLQSTTTSSNAQRIAFHAPISTPTEIQSTDKITLDLDINPQDVEAELEQIRQIAEAKNSISIKNRKALHFDPIEDTPTLSHQTPTTTAKTFVPEPTAAAPIAPSDYPDMSQNIPEAEIPKISQKPEPTSAEIHETIAASLQNASLNDALSKPQKELSERLQETPIKDLKKAIGINDRYLFIQELFKGDEAMYERCIKTINAFSIYPEAEYWIRRELKTKLGWNDQSEASQAFAHLVKRRFSAM